MGYSEHCIYTKSNYGVTLEMHVEACTQMLRNGSLKAKHILFMGYYFYLLLFTYFSVACFRLMCQLSKKYSEACIGQVS